MHAEREWLWALKMQSKHQIFKFLKNLTRTVFSPTDHAHACTDTHTRSQSTKNAGAVEWPERPGSITLQCVDKERQYMQSYKWMRGKGNASLLVDSLASPRNASTGGRLRHNSSSVNFQQGKTCDEDKTTKLKGAQTKCKQNRKRETASKEGIQLKTLSVGLPPPEGLRLHPLA